MNDDSTRSFLSLEITTSGLSEVCYIQQDLPWNVLAFCILSIILILVSLIQIIKQIDAVNEVYKLHNLPEFYKVHFIFYIQYYFT